MSQSSRACPTCGVSVPAGQRFCSNCGTDLQPGQPMGPVSQYGGTQPSQGQGQQPYPQAPFAQQGQQFQFGQPQQFGQPLQPYQQPQQKSNPIAEALGALGLLFFMRRYRPGYRPRRQSSGCCGCLVLLVILAIVVGIPGYLYIKQNPQVLQQAQSRLQSAGTISGDSGSTGDSGGVPTTQPPITTTKIGQTVNYSGVDITVVSVEKSKAFLDDNSTASDGMVRVKLHESAQQVGLFFYSSVALLMLPDKSSIHPTKVQNDSSPDSQTVRDNWMDFKVPFGDRVDQLTLVLEGSDQQARVTMPLTGSANLTAFQPKTATPNTPINYWDLNWTLVSATRIPSANGKEADAGMRFVVLTFKVDNPTSNNIAIGLTNDYMRLKSGGITSSPSDTTLPLYSNANTTGTTGTVTFQMPEDATAYTLDLLATQGGASAPASSNFQI